MSDPRPVAGHLVRSTRKLQVAAIVACGFAAFCYLGAFTSTSRDSFQTFIGLFYLAAFGAVVLGVGAVVGRLLLAARRDDEERAQAAPSESSQNWYQ